jgi:hypothetical protein
LNIRVKTKHLATAIVTAGLCAGSVHAQTEWANYPTKGIPRLADGKPDLAAPAPRTSAGKPDVSGIWKPESGKYIGNIAADLKPGDISFQPWAAAVFEERKDGARSREEPDANCLPPGVPKIDAVPFPFRIVQTAASVTILYEAWTLYRQVFMDGRPLPKDPEPNWLGSSVGKWDGDTLVVDTIGFNGKFWLDSAGYPATDALHVTERFHRTDFGHMALQITIDDAKAYTKPWTVTEPLLFMPDTEIMEFYCDNEKDLVHLRGK